MKHTDWQKTDQWEGWHLQNFVAYMGISYVHLAAQLGIGVNQVYQYKVNKTGMRKIFVLACKELYSRRLRGEL